MSRVLAAILAAGASRRLGRPKQLVEIDGSPLLRRTIDTVLRSRCASVAVVLGAEAHTIRTSLDLRKTEVLFNPQWERGIASSIRTAVDWCELGKGDALLLAVCDQPRLSAEHLDRLIFEYQKGALAVGSAYGNTVGVPALFAASLFPELRSLEGDRGARAILAGHPARAAIPWPQGVLDIDTERDLANAGKADR